jgi:CO/xanthine dehydrogenase FAD-binding subunit
LAEALNLLASSEGAKVLAGGQSLITLMKLRLSSPNVLIDINGLSELTQIREENEVVVIGALTRHDQLTNSEIIRRNCPLLTEAASLIADQQVRNRGTIGGSLAHADPAADLPTACSALGASVVASSLKGTRTIKSVDFFRDFFTTSLKEDEIICELHIPIPPIKSGGAYLKLTKGHNDFASVAVAAQMTLGDNNICKAASVVLGGVAATPIHAAETESLLTNSRLDGNVMSDGARRAAEGLSPPSDIRGSPQYRLKMVKVLTERALRISFSRAQGGA